jgi:aminoglycoside N3'-acetyltransferase
VHHVELIACVPYIYHKVLRGDVFAYGAQIESDFFMAVRYLNYDIAYDLSKLETDLIKEGAITQTSLGGDQVQSVSMSAVLEVLMKGLRQDPYFLLESVPTFVEGEIPLDGTTIQREGSAPNYFLTG